ncbi:alpha-glucosidase [Pedobacter sp. AK013]|uniref:glycoside hydrolase family 97 protein n=1 Tax=Pedobacter sp. AK013 TaxID=2723071 RepID=UPI00161A6CD6|nr:glycoside hydrolase family 97 protein [Pedobacter sp. AK013]MBB6235650.1 alpha-glucosidase [Pedobacter sp. AK013]
MKKKGKVFALLIALNLGGISSFAQVQQIISVQSPERGTKVDISLFSKKEIRYRMSKNGKEILSWSALGLQIDSNEVASELSIISTSGSSHRENIINLLGENRIINNDYTERRINLKSKDYYFSILFRVFDGSLAIRYIIPQQKEKKELSILKEKTAFNLNGQYQIYQYHQESVFRPLPVDSLKGSSDLPSTLTAKDAYLSIGEAENTGYTKAELSHGTAPGSLQVSFEKDNRVKAILPFQSPWRTISFSKNAIGLHQFSELPFKLSSAPLSNQPDEPVAGKLMRAQLDTQSALDCIDLAEKMDFKYIMFDAGWYGPERSVSSDPRVPIAAIDMEKVISYGRQHGVGLIVYVNYIGLQAHLYEILPLYKKWGVKGIKFGFIDGLSQKGLQWLSSAIKKVNDYGLLLNIHDNYKPTGLNRTYPFLLTQEGIRGDENSPDAFHTTVLPYTRFLAGAADFTFCFPNPKNQFNKNLKVSKGQQLALTVINFSPLQSIFWYGKPKDYTNWDEIEFFSRVPTVWDRTIYLQGEIGKSISVARKKGNNWFIGSAAGENDWKGTIVMDFLDANKSYTATIWEDTGEKKLSKKTITVKRGYQMPFMIRAAGGIAIEITPS